MSNLLTPEEVAKELEVSTKTLYRWDLCGYFVPEKKEPNIRLYDSHVVGYWKVILKLDRSLKNHLKLLDGLRDRLNKHNLEQDYIPGKNLKLMTEEDIKHFSEAYEVMEKWSKDYRDMLNAIKEYPESMLKATTEKY